jgi:hypothetical protein
MWGFKDESLTVSTFSLFQAIALAAFVSAAALSLHGIAQSKARIKMDDSWSVLARLVIDSVKSDDPDKILQACSTVILNRAFMSSAGRAVMVYDTVLLAWSMKAQRGQSTVAAQDMMQSIRDAVDEWVVN